MNIYVGNLNYKVQEEDVKDVFETYGDVTSVKLISDKITGRAKGFGFVEMSNDQEALDAIENLDGHQLMEREMRVNQAKPRDNS
ncbi:MAG: RNA-binding protein [Flavobacteriales bacterium]|jgi:RNA recognition motif-containing protein|nr:RNA-binding protein [Flavobacteriales bacterium]